MTAIADNMDAFANDPEMVAMFVSNAAELTEQIETDLVAIEKIPTAQRFDVVNRIFRAAHTIKGESGFVGLSNIGRLAHGMENILDQVREARIEPTHQVVSTLLTSLDTLRQMIDCVEESHNVDLEPQLAQLARLDAATQTAVPTIVVAPPVIETPASAQPVVVKEPTPVAPTRVVPTLNATSRVRVLIVDDEPVVLSIATRQLNKAGILVDQVENAEGALKLMRSNLYNVVICDLNLPGMSGVELLHQLKSISPMVQVVMLTGYANLVTVLESLEGGAADFLPKGQDYDQLVDIVRDALVRVDRWVPLMKSRR